MSFFTFIIYTYVARLDTAGIYIMTSLCQKMNWIFYFILIPW